MTRIKSIIKCIISKPGYNGNKQLESRPEHWAGEARTRMIRAVGEVWLAGWWIVICAMGTMPCYKIAMCPPVTWSDQSRMFTRRFPFSLSLIFTTSQCKAGCNYRLLFLSRPLSPHARSDLPVLSKCEYGNYSRNVDSVPSFYPPPTPLSSVPASPLSLSGPVWVYPSLPVALWRSPCEHLQTLTHSHDTQVRIIKMSSVIKIFSDIAFWNSRMKCIS